MTPRFSGLSTFSGESEPSVMLVWARGRATTVRYPLWTCTPHAHQRQIAVVANQSLWSRDVPVLACTFGEL